MCERHKLGWRAETEWQVAVGHTHTHVRTQTHTRTVACFLSRETGLLPVPLSFSLSLSPFSSRCTHTWGSSARNLWRGKEEQGVHGSKFCTIDADYCCRLIRTTGFTTEIYFAGSAGYAIPRLLRYDSTIVRVFFVLFAVGPRACVAAGMMRRPYTCACVRACTRAGM